MDFGLFRNFQPIESTPLPRTRQERGLFLIELRLALNEETRSVPVAWQLGRSAFGEVTRLVLINATKAAPALLQDPDPLFAQLQPAASLSYHRTKDELTIRLMDQDPARVQPATGVVIFNPQGDLVTILARLGK